MSVSSALFEAYIECPTKCWLRSLGEPSLGNSYAEWARLQNDAYRRGSLKRLLAKLPESACAIAPLLSERAMDTTWSLAIDVNLHLNGLVSHLQAIERMPSEARVRSFQFVPYRFQFANKVAKNDKLALAFDAFVLSEAVGREVSLGKIVHGDGNATLKVKVSSLARDVQKRMQEITSLLASGSPPELVLNRHCPQCEFQARCRKQAVEKDDLSLLSGMSEKERRKHHGKGIFTVTQLSYTFRPRRRRQSQAKPEKFHHSLRALAIRTNKIHAVDLSGQKLHGTPVYLDVEGLPDRDFYYLVGLRVGTGDRVTQHTFWADDAEGERRVWNEFLDVLSTIPDPQLVHYGSYETAFLKRLGERHGGPCEGSAAAGAIKNPVNLLSLVFARIYFPTFSNGLKEIAAFLGFQWSGSPVSGLEAIAWRHLWESSADSKVKQELIDYNRQDCEALEVVANKLADLHRSAPANTENDLILTSEIKRNSPYPLRFGRNSFVLPELEVINRSAYWDYQRGRLHVKSGKKSKDGGKRQSTLQRAPACNVTIEYPRVTACQICNSSSIYRHGKRSRIEFDVRFMRHGIKRWITRYVIHRYRCLSCRGTFYPRDRASTISKYGRSLAAYVVYQNVELLLPQNRIASSIGQLLSLQLSRNVVNRLKAAAAQYYTRTYEELLNRLCNGSLLHVDETSASIKVGDGYVWVFTNMKEVAYFYTPTREG
jgi:predicted RecB family nuclease